jgi:hypothetical protein
MLCVGGPIAMIAIINVAEWEVTDSECFRHASRFLRDGHDIPDQQPHYEIET